MKTGATLFGVAAILAVLGYFGMQAFDRYEQRYAMRSNVELLAEALKRRDLSPNFHPGMSRVALLFGRAPNAGPPGVRKSRLFWPQVRHA